MQTLYTSAQMHQLDQALAAARGEPTFALMRDAASAALRVLRANWPQARQVLILAGGGNNGGDGWMLAALLQDTDVKAQIVALTDPASLQGDAAKAFACAKQAGVRWQPYHAQQLQQPLQQADVLVDAMLGSGLIGALRTPLDSVVAQLNAVGKPVLALDLPTGLQADNGVVAEIAVRADVTITFVGSKRGQFTAAGPDHCGRLVLDDLGWNEHCASLSRADTPPQQDTVALIDRGLLRRLPTRRNNSHKHDYGRVLVIAGQPGMAGAGLLSASAALRSGAGLVVLATSAAHAVGLHAAQPELMISAIPEATEHIQDVLTLQLQATDCVVFGPGIGRSLWAQQCWLAVQAEIARRAGQLPLVVDADGLYWLQQLPLADDLAQAMREHLMLTPHAGEAACLLDCSAADIEQQRFAQARALTRRWQALVVLKGNGSIVAAADGQLMLSAAGHPGMATAGSGDVLTGICAALRAARIAPEHAATVLSPLQLVAAAVYAHGLAAEHALTGLVKPARRGGAGMLASDIVDALPQVLA